MIEIVRVQGSHLIGFCPFHADDNPSLSIDLNKKLAHCFAGCTEQFHGKLIDLIAKDQRIPLNVAFRRYISGNWYEMAEDKVKKSSVQPFFHLSNGEVKWLPGESNKYLPNRGFSRGTIRYWNMQYSSEIRHIRIPVFSQGGELVCYSYRTIDDLVPKYLHPGFPKSAGMLFGENEFDNGFIGDPIFLFEGQLNAIWAWQNGFTHVLAFLGTPHKSQIDRMFKFGKNFIMCFDNDKAGESASSLVGKEINSRGGVACIIDIPKGVKDVQDLKSEELKNIMRRSHIWQKECRV